VAGTRKSPAEFDSTLTISFPNEGDGIVSFDAKFQRGSTFLSPYEAPLEGYKPELEWRFARVPRPDNGADPVEMINTTRSNQHFILRVRTVLDKDGKVESCHYAKIYGPLEFDGVRTGASHIRFAHSLPSPSPMTASSSLPSARPSSTISHARPKRRCPSARGCLNG